MKTKSVFQNSRAKSINLALMSLVGSLSAVSLSAGTFDLQVEVGYEFGGCGDSGIYCADPDSGFVIISNNGPAPFVGELRLDGVSGEGVSGHIEVHDTSGPGFVLAPGSSFRLEAGPESSNFGGYGKNQDDSDPEGLPDDGLQLSIVGASDGCAINFQVLDKNIHSGTLRENPFGVTLDNYILQGGD